MTPAAIKTIVGMRGTAETISIGAGVTTAAHRAMYTTAQARRRNLSKGIATKCVAGAAEAIRERIPVPAGSAGMTGAGKRGAMSREVRPALAEEGAGAVAAPAEGAGAVAVAGADKE
jgi:hypothetical protein